MNSETTERRRMPENAGRVSRRVGRGAPETPTRDPGMFGSRSGRKLVPWLLGTALFLCAVPGVAQSEDGAKEAEPASEQASELPEPDEVMERLDTLYRSDASHAVMKMVVEKPRGKRELKLESWSKGEERMLVVIREPAREAGTATLRTPDGLWNYLPRADRLMRIPSGMLSDNWMGSHFTNDDLMRETAYDEDYEGTVERAEVDGREMLELTLTPRPEAPVVYSKMTFVVTPSDWVPVRQRFYDDGEVVRTMTFSDVEEVAGRKIPQTMTLRPSGESEEYTRMTYETLEFDVDLDDRLFSRRGLRRRAD